MLFLMLIKRPKYQEVKTFVGGTELVDQNQLKPHETSKISKMEEKRKVIISQGQSVCSFFSIIFVT